MIIKSSNGRIIGDYKLLTVEFKPVIPATRMDEADLTNKYVIIGHIANRQVILAVFDTEEDAILNLKAIYGLIPGAISLCRRDLDEMPVELR